MVATIEDALEELKAITDRRTEVASGFVDAMAEGSSRRDSNTTEPCAHFCDLWGVIRRCCELLQWFS
jgi:hypothetical protein